MAFVGATFLLVLTLLKFRKVTGNCNICVFIRSRLLHSTLCLIGCLLCCIAQAVEYNAQCISMQAELHLTLQNGNWFLRSSTLFIANIVIGSICLAAALTSAIIFGHRLRLVHTSGKKW